MVKTLLTINNIPGIPILSYVLTGSAHYSLKQYETAIQYHKDQLLLATELKSRKTAAQALGCLGHNYSAIGKMNKCCVI